MSKTKAPSAAERLTIFRRNVRAEEFTITEALPHLGIELHSALHSIQRGTLKAKASKPKAKGTEPKGYVVSRASLLAYLENQAAREAKREAA